MMMKCIVLYADKEQTGQVNFRWKPKVHVVKMTPRGVTTRTQSWRVLTGDTRLFIGSSECGVPFTHPLPWQRSLSINAQEKETN